MSNNNNKSGYKQSEIGFSKADNSKILSKEAENEYEESNLILSSAVRLKPFEDYVDNDKEKITNKEIESKAIKSKSQSKVSNVIKPKRKLKSNWDDEYI